MKQGNIHKWSIGAIAALLAVGSGWTGLRHAGPEALAATPTSTPTAHAADAVDLNETQAKAVTIQSAGQHAFSSRRTAVGSIDFNEDLSVQVFPPYQGRIIQTFAELGQHVAKGQKLYTIDSPDLVQAESALIAAAGVADLTSAALARARDLVANQGLAQKDFQQAVSDQQTAEASLKAAREAVRVFGKSESEIDALVARRRIDPALVVASPIAGQITARAAQPGLFVQPGNGPAPYAVADLSNLWMMANVAESDAPGMRVGLPVTVKVMALPDREFSARIAALGATVDPGTHTMQVRSVVADPEHLLRPGMLATFTIDTGRPVMSVAVPLDGVVREGDGTHTVWTTQDRRHFTKRTVNLGLQQDGLDQIVDGLHGDELVVTTGAVLLSNLLDAPPTD